MTRQTLLTQLTRTSRLLSTTLMGAALAGALGGLSSAHAAPSANAASGATGSIYGTVGPLGLSLGYGIPLTDKWVSRIQLHSGSLKTYTEQTDLSGIRYESKAKLGAGLSALMDYYPWADSGWRATAGLVYARMNPTLTGKADAQGNININGHTYTAAQVGSLTGKMRFNSLSLYLGGGWESAPVTSKGWRFVSDAGVFYAGKSSPTLTATGASSNATLKADVAAEQKELAKQGWGAAIGLGAAYSF